MSYRALTQVMRGVDAPVEPGEPIPDTYRDLLGSEHKVDFERLVALGAAEKLTPAAKAKKPEPAAGDPETR